MATTEAAVLDRVRDVLTGFDFTEAPGLDFARVPVGAADKAFALRWASLPPRGGMSFREEARGVVTVSVVRLIGEDYEAAQRTLIEDARTIVNAIVRDGDETSGEYTVEDSGRGLDIEAPKGANHLIGRVRVPVNFEAQL